jgi:hypothetical protein
MITDCINAIKPGKNYPAKVCITEPDGMKVEFYLNSFMVGMYCAIHVNGNLAVQTGDHNNASFARKLKKELLAAVARGAIVEVSALYPVKST